VTKELWICKLFWEEVRKVKKNRTNVQENITSSLFLAGNLELGTL
jgi:hypothetical protein